MNSYNILPPDVKKNVVRLCIGEGRTAEILAMEYGIAKFSIGSVKRFSHFGLQTLV